MSTADHSTAARPRAGRREWAGLAVLALPLLVLSIDVSILYLAAPELSVDLGASATEQLWILDIYGFAVGGLLLTMGTLGDRIGRRRLLLIGGAAFAVASVLAAFAPTPSALIAARALLGVAGATLMPSTLGLIATMFPDPRERATAEAVWMAVFSGGTAIGPMLGGLMLHWFWWGSVFLLGVPVMVLLLALGPRLLPESRFGGTVRVDLTSVTLSLAAMLLTVWAVKETATHGLGAAAVVALAIGLAAGVAFVRRQRRSSEPMLDLTLFRRRAFLAAVTMIFLGLVALNGLFFLLPQYLKSIAGLAPAAAGTAMLPVAVATMLATLATPRATARWGPRPVLTVGIIAAGAGAAGIGIFAGGGTTVLVVALSAVAVLGIAPVGMLAANVVIGAVPHERAGAAAAISETSGELGVALGVASVGSMVATVYGTRLKAGLPANLPAPALEAADDGVASALRAAESVDPISAEQLRAVALDAFGHAFGVVGWVSSGIAVTILALALTAIRPTATVERPDPEIGRHGR